MLWIEIEASNNNGGGFEANAIKFTWKFGTQNLAIAYIMTLR